MCAGGALPGVSAVVAVVAMLSHGWADRTVVRNDWRLVWGIASNVHSMARLLGGGAPASPGLTSMVMVPRHVPVKNDEEADGPAGLGDDRPHAVATTSGISNKRT